MLCCLHCWWCWELQQLWVVHITHSALTSTPVLPGYTSGLHKAHCLCTHTTSPSAGGAAAAPTAEGGGAEAGRTAAGLSELAAVSGASAAALLTPLFCPCASAPAAATAEPAAASGAGAAPAAAVGSAGWPLPTACFAAGGIQTGMSGPRPLLLSPELRRALAWSMCAPGASGAWHRAHVAAGGGSLCTSACGHQSGGEASRAGTAAAMQCEQA